MISTELKNRAIRDFKRGDRIDDIANRYGRTVGTISIWASTAGVKQRTRGCRVKTMPSQMDLEITECVRRVKDGKPSLREIGELYGFTRANVHRIYKKWKDYVPVIPFKAGDRIRFMDKDYAVLKPELFQGLVRELKTGQESTILWRLPVGTGKKRKVYRATKI